MSLVIANIDIDFDKCVSQFFCFGLTDVWTWGGDMWTCHSHSIMKFPFLRESLHLKCNFLRLRTPIGVPEHNVLAFAVDRDAVARHGPVDTQIYGTARHGKSWHSPAQRILAQKNIGTAWHKNMYIFGRHILGVFISIRSPHLATVMIFLHIWEDRSQTVNMNEPDSSFFHGNCWPFISHAVRKPCPRGGVPVSPFPLKMIGS